MWDKSHKDTEQLVQKYLNFIESVRTSDECDELKKFVEANVVENKNMKKEEPGVVEKILTLIETNLGKSDLEQSTEKWMNFSEVKQQPGESIKDYVTRFEQIETGLRNAKMVIPQRP